MQKYNVINAWKGIFCILIFFEHFGIWGLDGNTGYYVVECFFVVSGFLLGKSINDRGENLNLLPYIFHKIKGIYPLYIWGIIIMFFFHLLPCCEDNFPSLFNILAEICLLQKSGLVMGNTLNGSDWYVSAYILSSIIILIGMKIIKNYYLRVAISIIIVSYYVTYMIQFGNYDITYSFGFLNSQLIKGIACMLIGIGTYVGCQYLSKKQVNQSVINILEIILTFFFLLCIFDKTIVNVNVKILFVAIGLIICATYGNGLISKFVLYGGGVWKLSTSVYLTHLFSGNIFNYLFKQVNFSREIYIFMLTVWVLLFAYISKLITERYFNIKNMKKVSLLIKHRWNDYGVCFVSFVFITLCFLIQGKNVWAEVIAEYMPYANGASFKSSFAGYITLFPIIIAVIWNKLVRYTGMSYIVFMCVISYIYTLLCTFAIFKVLKGRNKNKMIFLLPLFAIVCHPSVQSIINITHLGYLPLVIHIVCCAEQNNMSNDIIDMRGGGIVYLPLVLALISKPSLLFPLLIFVIFSTKLYRNILQFIFTVLAIMISGGQTLLYSGAGNSLNVSGISGLAKAGMIFIHSVGASTIFNFVGYIEHFNNQSILIFLSFLCGGIIIAALAFRVIQNKSYNSIIGVLAIIITLGCVNLPYMMIDYNKDIDSIIQLNLSNCFSKYKLQYQLTSGIISFMVFIYCAQYIYHNVIKQYDKYVYSGMKFICIALALNGLLNGFYHGVDITVNGLNSKIINYDNKSHYMYAPYPDWDYSWSQASCGGWINGNKVVKYLEKPSSEGEPFQSYNNVWQETNIESQNALIYLMLSENAPNGNKVLYWLNFLNNFEQIYSINKNLNITFSKVSENGIRYAVMPYTEDMFNLLKDDNFTLSLGDLTINSDRLNCILIW